MREFRVVLSYYTHLTHSPNTHMICVFQLNIIINYYKMTCTHVINALSERSNIEILLESLEKQMRIEIIIPHLIENT